MFKCRLLPVSGILPSQGESGKICYTRYAMLKTELICCVQLSFQVLIGVDQNIEEPLVICSYLCVERSSICCIVSRAFIVALHPFLASKKLACAIQFSLTHLLACMSKLSSL